MKKWLSSIIVMCVVILANTYLQAQTIEKIFFDSAWNKTSDSTEAWYYRIIKRDNNNYIIAQLKDYYITGELQMAAGKAARHKDENSRDSICTWYYKSGIKKIQCNYTNKAMNGWLLNWDSTGHLTDSSYYVNDTVTGRYFSFYTNKKPNLVIDYTNGEYNGSFIKYYPNGKIRRQEEYHLGKLVEKGTCYDSTGKKVKYYPWATPPQSPSGYYGVLAYIQKSITIPQEAKEKNHQGTVLVNFEVTENGSIADVKVMATSRYPELDSEAVRVVKSQPKWKPGQLDGHPYSDRYSVPVRFYFKSKFSK